MWISMAGTAREILSLYSLFTVMSCIIKEIIFYYDSDLNLWSLHLAWCQVHREQKHVCWMAECDCSWTIILHAATVGCVGTPDKTYHSSSQGVKKDLKSLKTHRIWDWTSPLSALLSAWGTLFQKRWEIITLSSVLWFGTQPFLPSWILGGYREDYYVLPIFWEFASLCKGPLI